jgi:GNAT superfamily N-acetyltransferase
MTATDLAFGMRLKQQAGWNQTEADWRRALDLEPDGCFVAELDGRPVGTTTTCIFGPVAWVALVLVDATVRGRGIGTALMRHALAFLDERGVRSVRLDATPLGRPIYEKLGFVPQFELARYDGVLPSCGGARWVRPAGRNDLDRLLSLDRDVTGTDRHKLLLDLFTARFADLRVTNVPTRELGFITARPGEKAVQIGPCIAHPDTGHFLLKDAWGRYAGQRVFIDIPTAHTTAVELAEAQGLARQRHLLRMCRGEWVQERIEWLWASSGPEKG